MIFNLELAKKHLCEHPMQFHVAVAKGFKKPQNSNSCPYASEAKANYFEKVEKELLSSEKLEFFRELTSGELKVLDGKKLDDYGFTVGKDREMQSSFGKKQKIMDLLESFDKEIRSFLLKNFIDPLEKTFRESKKLIHDSMKKIYIPEKIGEELSEELSLQLFIDRIRDATLNASSQFMALLYLVIQKTRKQKLNQANFLKAITNNLNLLQQWARMHESHFHFLRDYALPNEDEMLKRVYKYGKGKELEEKLSSYANQHSAPAFEIYYEDAFDLIQSPDGAQYGLQLVNNERALEKLDQVFQANPLDIRIKRDLKLLSNTEAHGCPALRIKFGDVNFVDYINKWLVNVVENKLLPHLTKLGAISKR